MEASWNIPINDPSQIGEARRIATALASSLLFNETDSGKVALVVTEIGNNIHRHAQHGELLIRSVHDEVGTGVEILGVDRGVGMSNLGLCMEDGFSTKGTAGIGLGGIRRLSSVFAIESKRGRGTCILSRVHRSQPNFSQLASSFTYDCGVVSVPHPHERVSGDDYLIHQSQGICTAMVVDGLGHGLLAAEAAQRACRILQEYVHAPLEDILQKIHSGLRGTRGAAVGIARIVPSQQELHFIGVGNIAGSIVQRDGSSRSLMSYPGIVGHEMRKARELPYPWTDKATLVLHSDGIQSHWNALNYVQALDSEASILAGTLYRDFNRGRDDVTVLAIKWRTARSPLA